jgi:predicted dinucleotide-utilizing enzyme
MTKPKPKNTELRKGQWVELPSGAIVSIRDIREVITVTRVAEVRTLDADGAMNPASMDLSLEFLLNKGKVLKLDELTDEAA